MPNKFVYSNRKFKSFLGDSWQARYLVSYLSALNAKRCVVEDQYIDKDFAIDYQRYYSRSHAQITKFTQRIHFFSTNFSNDDFKQMLSGENDELVQTFQTNYLGFIIVKPILDSRKNKLIGRTCLQHYQINDGTMKRHYITNNHNVSLFGIPLSVLSVPFQAQDRRVSACATVALWTALHTVAQFYDIGKLSPVEITELSSQYPSRNRVFPQTGLTIEQMIICLRGVGLDVEVINITNRPDDHALKTAVKAYSNAGLPLIFILLLGQQNRPDQGHAVVNTGYKTNQSEEIIELYIHDDTIGPYSKVLPVMPANNLRFWNNEWVLRGYTVRVDYILIPIYHKMRLEFSKIYSEYNATIQTAIEYFEKDDTLDSTLLNIELLLYTIQDYKKEIFSKNIQNKKAFLVKTLPRFLWVIRSSYNRTIFQDQVYDGTATYPTLLDTVLYL